MARLLPLAGISVVEFSQVAAGPFCGMLLADYGADVTKIEPPGGDSLRQWPPISSGGHSENFASLNRSKRSVELDLKKPEDRYFARALGLAADVIIENNRPGVMERLGLGWDWFSSRKPTLIYCSISAYGQTGPRAGEGGFDLTIQAAAGVMSVTGEPEGAPVKCGVPLVDFTAGLYGAFTIAALLARVRAGGTGCHVDVPMFGTTLAIAALQTSEYFGTGVDPRKLGSAHPRNAPYQAFQARDGWFAIAAGNNKLWRSVCEVVGAVALHEDARFSTPALRASNQGELNRILTERFVRDDVDSWLRKFESAGVPGARINSYSEALADPQTEHMGLVQSLRLPDGHETRTIGCPVRLGGENVALRGTVPGLGEGNDALRAAVLKERGR